MDNQGDVREFLTSRRARITPVQAGLPDFGGTRRVTGLRRAEVALLAGVSPDYYTRLERGNLTGVSSVSSPPAATTSAAAGPRTTSACTTPASSTSSTPPSAASTSRSRPCRCPPTRG